MDTPANSSKEACVCLNFRQVQPFAMTAEYVIHCSVVYLTIYKNRFILRQPFYELSELYKMGLVNSVTKKWLDNGMQETSEEMTDYIMSFILKI